MPSLRDSRQEKFCQLLCSGLSQTEAYIQSRGPLAMKRNKIADAASMYARQPQIRARIEEIRAPVIEEIRQGLKFNLEQAFEEIDLTQRYAMALMQPQTALKAIELKAKLVKLLGGEKQVGQGGALDELSTEDLVELQQILAERKALRDAPNVVKLTRASG